MPRRTLHARPTYKFGLSEYLINVVPGSGVYRNIMDAICAQLTWACKGRGRWSLLHIRYVLDDGVRNRLLLDQLRTRFGKHLRYLWVIEESKQEEARFHFHMMLLIESRNINVRSVRYALIDWKNKGLLHAYRRMPPDLSKMPCKLRELLNMRDLKRVASPYGLELSNESALRYAIYWMSYLAKFKTKILGSQRNFGQTKVDTRWMLAKQKELPFE